MDSEADDPLAMLEALKGLPVVNALDGNALILHFLKPGGSQAEGRMLRIQHPWRLLFGKVVVGESVEFDGRDSRGSRDRSSLGFACWVPGKIDGFSLGVGSPDLWLTFESGHVLEAISEPGLTAEWSLRRTRGKTIVTGASLAGYSWRELCVS